jgi:hypothetical protein
MTELEENSGPYELGTRWAAPDVEDAGRHMRWVFENRPESAALGARGAASIRTTLNPKKTAAEIRQRVQELSAEVPV